MRAEMLDERVPPRLACLGIAERVELERHAVRDAKLLQQLVAQAQYLDVGLRLRGANDLRIELVELAEATLLRALVTERRAVRRDLQRSILLPSLAQVRAAD